MNLQLRAGDWVRLRNGWIVGPLEEKVKDSSNYPFFCDSKGTVLSWRLDGHYYLDQEHELDIVSVVCPPFATKLQTTKAVVQPTIQPSKPSRYHRQFQGVTLDLYRVAKLWGVASHALFHALKKIMMAGGRGHKDKATDLKEAIVSIEEELKMMEEEDGRKEI